MDLLQSIEGWLYNEGHAILTEMADEFSSDFEAVNWPAALVRLGMAILLGGIIGFEREYRTKAAGLRTHMMISLAACLFTLLAFELAANPMGAGDALRIDPLRLIEAVTSGVAFLAAGTILFNKGKVRNLTTGAGMWLAGAVGLACGLGRPTLAAMAVALTVIVQAAFHALRPFLPREPDK